MLMVFKENPVGSPQKPSGRQKKFLCYAPFDKVSSSAKREKVPSESFDGSLCFEYLLNDVVMRRYSKYLKVRSTAVEGGG
jgi:hypothetical protein